MSANGSPYADTRDMYTVHAVFRREFALLPRLVRAVAAKDEERARIVADHVRLMSLVLHHHHWAEDSVLWCRLRQRAPREIDPVVHLMEGQHEILEILIGDVSLHADAWTDGAGITDGEALAVVLQRLADGLYQHMGLEERLVLPLAERHIFAAEWEAMVAIGVADLLPDLGPLVVGMLMYESGLDAVPLEMRDTLAEVAPTAYASYCQRVHGTPTPPRSSDVAVSLCAPYTSGALRVL